MPPIPENSFSGNAPVIWAIFARESGRIAGPPRPPVDDESLHVHFELQGLRSRSPEVT